MDEQTQSAKVDSQSVNAYETDASTHRVRVAWILSAIGVGIAIVVGLRTGEGPTLWGLLPIILYAIVCLIGMDILVASVVALVVGLVLAHQSFVEAGATMGAAMGDSITVIGMVIMLGAGVGEVLRATGVARTIVLAIVRLFGERSRAALTFGVMISCLVLVACLGTLAGALAIAAPILLPIVSRMGFTRSATAAMMFVGGCAGLAIAPFAGSNVAIMEAAEIGYGTYLLYGAGPLAIVSLALGAPVVRWMQRRTEGSGEEYTETDLGVGDEDHTAAGRATAVFGIVLVVSVVFATVTAAGANFPLVALPILAVVTGLAGGMSSSQILASIYKGASSLISVFLLFWVLAALFAVIDALAPFDVVMEMVGSDLAGSSAFAFAVIVALLGWVGVPGATAAQVVLLDEVFGGLAGTLGVSAAAWTIVLLFASKADTYGPFPNGNMVGVMGLARSRNIKNMLLTGWILLVPITLAYIVILFFETR